jgi:hypothetical protein
MYFPLLVNLIILSIETLWVLDLFQKNIDRDIEIRRFIKWWVKLFSDHEINLCQWLVSANCHSTWLGEHQEELQEHVTLRWGHPWWVRVKMDFFFASVCKETHWERKKRVNNENTNYCKIIIFQLFDTTLESSAIGDIYWRPDLRCWLTNRR